MTVGALLALLVLLVIVVLGRQLFSGGSAPTPYPTDSFMATLGAQQGTQNAITAANAGITLVPGNGPLDAIAQFSLATVTAQADWLLNYCESTYAGTRTPDECHTWVSQVSQTHLNDVVYCEDHSESTADMGVCLNDRKVPLPGAS
jgi:hypothetical protein